MGFIALAQLMVALDATIVNIALPSAYTLAFAGLVNAPIACAVAGGGWLTLPATRPAGRRRLDIPGALLSTGGLVALVYGCTQAAGHGWSSPPVVGSLAAAVALLASFVLQSKVAWALMPLRCGRRDPVAGRDQPGTAARRQMEAAGMMWVTIYGAASMTGAGGIDREDRWWSRGRCARSAGGWCTIAAPDRRRGRS